MVWTAKAFRPGHDVQTWTWTLPESASVVQDIRPDLANVLEKLIDYVEGIIEFREDARCELKRMGLC
jgi:hypothetical protein